MILNPYRTLLSVLPGSRVLRDASALGIVGACIDDPKRPGRVWRIVNLYAPIVGRHLGGIRAKLIDQKSFITFCNQRDLELLLELAEPGDLCLWTDEDYPAFDSKEFYGLCADDEDLEDDLFEHELLYRQSNPGVLPYGLEITRRVHVSPGLDVEELSTLLWDCDPETGMGPDPRLETLRHRWVQVERMKVRWERIQTA